MLSKMKQLEVEFLKTASASVSINEVSFFLDSVKRNLLNQISWPAYNYLPDVHFAMAYGSDSVFLKYYVNEKFIRAANGAANDPVYQDSCVEFFISFDDEKSYYNFEFNCIGTAMVGYGEGKMNRELLPKNLISQIKYQCVINNDQPGNDIHWELTVGIPISLFWHNPLTELKDKKCRANFYKCGDQLPEPHFVSWLVIQSLQPDFHLPEFFGSLHFI